ncbi:hypothetical protein JCM10908_005896 [Rhodotorula pacifica]|uniref:uncharacterized protein n=1 Tax=Rhodotorula pacifica TaxID=1495444 RepID=UPI003174ED80
MPRMGSNTMLRSSSSRRDRYDDERPGRAASAAATSTASRRRTRSSSRVRPEAASTKALQARCGAEKREVDESIHSDRKRAQAPHPPIGAPVEQQYAAVVPAKQRVAQLWRQFNSRPEPIGKPGDNGFYPAAPLPVKGPISLIQRVEKRPIREAEQAAAPKQAETALPSRTVSPTIRLSTPEHHALSVDAKYKKRKEAPDDDSSEQVEEVPKSKIRKLDSPQPVKADLFISVAVKQEEDIKDVTIVLVDGASLKKATCDAAQVTANKVDASKVESLVDVSWIPFTLPPSRLNVVNNTMCTTLKPKEEEAECLACADLVAAWQAKCARLDGFLRREPAAAAILAELKQQHLDLIAAEHRLGHLSVKKQ